MTIQLSIVTDPNLPEPKGVATANSGEAYVANGAGSGTWQKVQVAGHSCMKCTSSATTGVTTSFLPINVASLGGAVAWTENTAYLITTDVTSGYFTVPTTGTYQVNANVSFLASTNPSTFTLTIGVDSGAGIVEKSSTVQAILTTTKTTETNVVTLMCLPPLTANDKVYLLIKEAAGNELTIQFANFILTRVM